MGGNMCQKVLALRWAAFVLICACTVMARSSVPEDNGPDPAFISAVWVGGTVGIAKLNQVTTETTFVHPDAGDVFAASIDDSSFVVWLFNGTQVRVVDFLGNTLKTVQLTP